MFGAYVLVRRFLLVGTQAMQCLSVSDLYLYVSYGPGYRFFSQYGSGLVSNTDPDPGKKHIFSKAIKKI